MATAAAFAPSVKHRWVAIKEERPTTWTELLASLTSTSHKIFRGSHRENDRLLSALQKVAGPQASNVEAKALRDFLRLCPGSRKANVWETLAEMNHWRAPTRLLPWSYNPLVAVLFAVVHGPASPQAEDGVVWCLDDDAIRALQCIPEGLRALADGSMFSELSGRVLNSVGDAASTVTCAPCVDTASVSELQFLTSLEKDGPFCLFASPTEQSAHATVYSIMSNASTVFDEWLERAAPHAAKRVIVPARLKCEALHKLAACNITDRYLDPTPEGLSRWIVFGCVPSNGWACPRASIEPPSKSIDPPDPESASDRKTERRPGGSSAETKMVKEKVAKPTVPPLLGDVVRTYRPSTWEELLTIIFSDELMWSERHGIYRPPLVYRGVPDASWRTLTRLQRMAGLGEQGLRRTEERAMRLFRRHCRGVCPDLRDDDLRNVYSLISIMHSYKSPTRLLDWSKNPLVSLFFAVSDPSTDNVDGAVICLNSHKAAKLVPTAISRSVVSTALTAAEIENSVRNSDSYMLSSMKQMNVTNASTRASNFDDLHSLAQDGDPFLFFLEPVALGATPVNQASVFTLMSSPEAVFDDWVVRHSDLCFRIVIPAGLKRQAREQLDKLKINECTLFPTVEGACAWIRRNYSSK